MLGVVDAAITSYLLLLEVDASCSPNRVNRPEAERAAAAPVPSVTVRGGAGTREELHTAATSHPDQPAVANS